MLLTVLSGKVKEVPKVISQSILFSAYPNSGLCALIRDSHLNQTTHSNWNSTIHKHSRGAEGFRRRIPSCEGRGIGYGRGKFYFQNLNEIELLLESLYWCKAK